MNQYSVSFFTQQQGRSARSRKVYEKSSMLFQGPLPRIKLQHINCSILALQKSSKCSSVHGACVPPPQSILQFKRCEKHLHFKRIEQLSGTRCFNEQRGCVCCSRCCYVSYAPPRCRSRCERCRVSVQEPKACAAKADSQAADEGQAHERT